MQSDLPHTIYRNIRKDKGTSKKHRDNAELPHVADDEVIRLQEEANRRARERREAKARGELPYTIQELFSK